MAALASQLHTQIVQAGASWQSEIVPAADTACGPGADRAPGALEKQGRRFTAQKYTPSTTDTAYQPSSEYASQQGTTISGFTGMTGTTGMTVTQTGTLPSTATGFVIGANDTAELSAAAQHSSFNGDNAWGLTRESEQAVQPQPSYSPGAVSGHTLPAGDTVPSLEPRRTAPGAEAGQQHPVSRTMSAAAQGQHLVPSQASEVPRTASAAAGGSAPVSPGQQQAQGEGGALVTKDAVHRHASLQRAPAVVQRRLTARAAPTQV
jgi:hypothetical protein